MLITHLYLLLPFPRIQSSQSQNPSKTPQLTFASHPKVSQITLNARQNSLKGIHSSLSVIYSPLTSSKSQILKSLGSKLLHDVSLEQESEIFKTSNKHSYKNACITTLVGIKKRELEQVRKSVEEALEAGKDVKAFYEEKEKEKSEENFGKEELAIKVLLDSCSELGTQSQVISKRNSRQERKINELTRERLLKVGFECPIGELSKWDFVTNEDLKIGGIEVQGGGSKPDCEGEKKVCERCDREFIVRGEEDFDGERGRECHYHW